MRAHLPCIDHGVPWCMTKALTSTYWLDFQFDYMHLKWDEYEAYWCVVEQWMNLLKNYKYCKLWGGGERKKKITLRTLDWSVNMLTNNLLAILQKEKKMKDKKRSFTQYMHQPACWPLLLRLKDAISSIVSPNKQTNTHQAPQLPNLLQLPSPLPHYFKMHKEEGYLNKREYLTCLQRIWDKCDYMFKM